MSIRYITDQQAPRKILAGGGIAYNTDLVAGRAATTGNVNAQFFVNTFSASVRWEGGANFGNINVTYQIMGRKGSIFCSGIVTGNPPSASSNLEIGVGAFPQFFLDLLPIGASGAGIIGGIQSGNYVTFAAMFYNSGTPGTSGIVLENAVALGTTSGITINNFEIHFLV